MLRFYAAGFLTVTHNLEGVRNLLLTASTVAPEILIDWDYVERCLTDLEKELHELPVSLSLREQAKRLLDTAQKRDRKLVPHMVSVTGEVSHNVANELTTHLFLLIPTELKWHYLEPENVIGQAFESFFPEAIKD